MHLGVARVILGTHQFLSVALSEDISLEFEWMFGWDTPLTLCVKLPPHTWDFYKRSYLFIGSHSFPHSVPENVPHKTEATRTSQATYLRNPFPPCLCCRATNLESMGMIHTILSINPDSCVCSCDVYKHRKCYHIRAIRIKYWIVFTSLVSTDGKIWAHIWSKTSYDSHSVNT